MYLLLQVLPELDEPVLEFMVQVCQATNQVDPVSGNSIWIGLFWLFGLGNLFARRPAKSVERTSSETQIRNPAAQVENNNINIAPNPQRMVEIFGSLMQFWGKVLNVIWENAGYIKLILLLMVLIVLLMVLGKVLNNPLFRLVFSLPSYLYSVCTTMFSLLDYIPN